MDKQIQREDTRPLITVVTVVFNGEQFLDQTIRSVIEQDYPHFEYLVIDGGSTDQSLTIISKYQEQIDNWLSEKDRGIYDAMNKGINLAKGEWIIFVNADDYLLDSQTLAACEATLKECDASVSMVYGSINLITNDGQVLQKVGGNWESTRFEMTYKMAIPHPGLFVRTEAIQKWGGFDTGFRIAGDYELCIRLLQRTTARFLENIVVSNMRVEGVSSNSRNAILSIKECELAREKNGLRKVTLHSFLLKSRVWIRIVVFRIFGDDRSRLVLDFLNKIVGRQNNWTKRK